VSGAIIPQRVSALAPPIIPQASHCVTPEFNPRITTVEFFANTQPALKPRANLMAPLCGEQAMPVDSEGLQFASSSRSLPKHDFNAAFLTAQEK
jgi:hypothetical protein